MSVPPKILGLSNGYNVSFNVSFKTNQSIYNYIQDIYTLFLAILVAKVLSKKKDRSRKTVMDDFSIMAN